MGLVPGSEGPGFCECVWTKLDLNKRSLSGLPFWFTWQDLLLNRPTACFHFCLCRLPLSSMLHLSLISIHHIPTFPVPVAPVDFKFLISSRCCHSTSSAPPPSQAGLTHRQSVLVGTIVAPRYPFPMPMAKFTIAPSFPPPHRFRHCGL